MLDSVCSRAADESMDEVVIGMAHRGRLNVLANVIGKSYTQIFREFEGELDPGTTQGSGDVKYHLGATGSHRSPEGHEIALTLAANPSHLEAVDPVVEGMARAKEDRLGTTGVRGAHVLPVLVHGDAAFAGQGVVAETLNLSEVEGYDVGGTVHIVVDNQLGFTTAPESGRSGVYATDVAKMVQAPIFHVNGDDPEACVRVMRIAFDFRQAFNKDVVVDLVCYRRYGHNEGDEPAFTQPAMYALIDQHRSVRKLYTELLVNRGDLTIDQCEAALADFQARLGQAFEETRDPTTTAWGRRARSTPASPIPASTPSSPRFRGRYWTASWPRSRRAPPGSSPTRSSSASSRANATRTRRATSTGRSPKRWPSAPCCSKAPPCASRARTPGGGRSASATACSSTTRQEPSTSRCSTSTPSRRASSSTTRCSRSTRRSASNTATRSRTGPRSSCGKPSSATSPNGAQIIIDEFVVAAYDKWGQRSSLALLLPHGFEGQGPDHSSARLERFLALCADENLRVVYPSTAAQYFHVLRRQARSAWQVPLICFTPKRYLRVAASRSPVDDLTSGDFRLVLDDRSGVAPATVERIALTTGKLGHELMDARDAAGVPTAVVRVEQLYPWPETELLIVLDRYPNVSEVCWVQEEPANMGAWNYVHGKLHRLLRGRAELRHVARKASASPASGSAKIHEREQRELIAAALDPNARPAAS